MNISELIKELEDFKEKHGDLEVRHSIGRVGDVEIDSVNVFKAHICLLNNSYLDNYTLRTSDKIRHIEEDIVSYAKKHNINCRKCKYYHHNWCFLELGKKKSLTFSEREWVLDKDKLFKCYSPNTGDVLEDLFYYRYLLLKEYDKEKEWYEAQRIDWRGSI